jgi:hypothetical protein
MKNIFSYIVVGGERNTAYEKDDEQQHSTSETSVSSRTFSEVTFPSQQIVGFEVLMMVP